MKRLKQFISRVLTKILMWDPIYLNQKLLLNPHIHGPIDRLIVGKDTDINNAVINTISGTVTIEDCAFLGHNCQLLTGTHDFTKKNNARRWTVPESGRDILIGQGAWIGSGVIILGNVSIADHAVIAAGSVVTQDCPEAAIYGGIPAKKIKDIEFSE
jgi:acetyltransferase-like isoleucine patch superfamily enzyme